MASGVSSMIRSQPVSVSMERMLRPSRPMMRPFISSLGSGTTETVISLAWSAAQRWMAVAIISRARFLGLVLVLGLDLADLGGHLVRHLGLDVGDRGTALASSTRVAGDLLQHLELALLDEPDLLLHAPRPGLSFWLRALGLLLKRVGLAVERSPPSAGACAPAWRAPPRRSLTSRSYSLRLLCISSRASTSASRFLDSAALMDSLMIRLASSSALEISRSATFLR